VSLCFTDRSDISRSATEKITESTRTRANTPMIVSGHLQHQRRRSSLSRSMKDESISPAMSLVINKRVPPSLGGATKERRGIFVVQAVFDRVQAVSLALL
jgi:hypothetical protein